MYLSVSSSRKININSTANMFKPRKRSFHASFPKPKPYVFHNTSRYTCQAQSKSNFSSSGSHSPTRVQNCQIAFRLTQENDTIHVNERRTVSESCLRPSGKLVYERNSAGRASLIIRSNILAVWWIWRETTKWRETSVGVLIEGEGNSSGIIYFYVDLKNISLH